MHTSKQIVSESLITPGLAAKMKVFFEGIDASTQVKYKHLCCTLQKENEKKQLELDSLNSKLSTISRPKSMMNLKKNKFMRLQAVEPCNTMASTNSFNSFQETYLSERMVSDSLQKQLLEYQNSLLKLRNNIKDINIEITRIKVKQPLYDKLNTISKFQKIASMYIVNKAENEIKKVLKQKQELTYIQADHQQKQNVSKIQNIEARNQMQQKISRLKLKRVTTKQQLRRLNNKVIIHQEESDIITILECFEKLLEQVFELCRLFGDKEDDYDNIKLQTCVKIGKPLKRSSVMTEEKIQEIIRINNFEMLHKIKVSSMNNIIESIFNSLKSSEEQLNFKYQELLLIKDDRLNDLDLMVSKITGIINSEKQLLNHEVNKRKLDHENNQIQNKIQFIKMKGRFWVQFTQFWRTLLLKISNIHRSLDLPQDNIRIKQQIVLYFIKYGHHQNTSCDATINLIHSIILEYFDCKLPKDIIILALDTFLSDWKSCYYLKQSNIQDEISRLPSAMPPLQQLYTLLDHLVIQSNECFRLYINHSTKLFISCYHLLNARKPLFSISKVKTSQKKYERVVKQENESGASQNNIKEEMRTNRSIQVMEDQKSKEYCDKVMIELLKMAAVPIGEFNKGKGSKRGCFY